jgi:hypothetical protein
MGLLLLRDVVMKLGRKCQREKRKEQTRVDGTFVCFSDATAPLKYSMWTQASYPCISNCCRRCADNASAGQNRLGPELGFTSEQIDAGSPSKERNSRRR